MTQGYIPKSTIPTINYSSHESKKHHVTSSIPGLSSNVDMSMTGISEENQVLMVKGCIKKHMFSMWKFNQKDFHFHFCNDDKTICEFIMKHTNIRGTQNCGLE
jgi:hypothetical protein